MLNIDQRIRVVEERMADHHELFADIRSDLARFEQRVDNRFVAMDARFGQVEARFGQVDARFSQMDARFDQLEARMDAGHAILTQRIDSGLAAVGVEMAAMRHDMTGQLRWTMGIMITGVIAIAAAIVAAIVTR